GRLAGAGLPRRRASARESAARPASPPAPRGGGARRPWRPAPLLLGLRLHRARRRTQTGSPRPKRGPSSRAGLSFRSVGQLGFAAIDDLLGQPQGGTLL